MLLEVHRQFVPVGGTQWEQRQYEACVWKYEVMSGMPEPVVYHYETPEYYTLGLLVCYIDHQKISCEEFDTVLKNVLNMTRSDIEKALAG